MGAAQLLEPSSAEEADNVPRSPVKKTPSTSTAASRLTRSRSRSSLKPSALEDTADSFVSCRDRSKRKAGAASSVLHGDGYDSENSVSSNDVINPALSSKLTKDLPANPFARSK